MYSLPILAPQDSHTLWYTTASSFSPTHAPSTTLSSNSSAQSRRHTAAPSQLARLRNAEAQVVARKHNIQNYGNSWIKPPGIPKSLYQIREEKRELEEHAEALRREALAQELAEAEAGEQGMDLGLGMEIEGGERDLDEEVPEADITALDDDDDEDDDEEEDDENDEEPSEEYAVPRGVLAARVPEDAYREALMRGSAGLDGALNDEDDGAGAGDMLQESDLIQTQASPLHMDSEMDMEVDLDAEVPEADEEYEHTDTEEELSSSEEGSSPGFGQRSGHDPAPSSMVRSDGTQNSMDMSSPQRFSGRRSGY